MLFSWLLWLLALWYPMWPTRRSMYELEEEVETRHNSVADPHANPRATPADYQQFHQQNM